MFAVRGGEAVLFAFLFESFDSLSGSSDSLLRLLVLDEFAVCVRGVSAVSETSAIGVVL